MNRNRISHSKRISSALTAFALTALGSSGFVAAQDSVPTVSYMYPGGTPKDLSKVQDAMNKILMENKANVQIKLRPIDFGEFDQKTKLMFASGEKCDIVFTAPWINNYFQNVAQGNLLDLSTLLPKVTPKLYGVLTPATWNAAKVNGKLYAVINQQSFVRRYGIKFRKDLATKYNLDLSKTRKLEDLEPFLLRVKKGEGAAFNPLTSGGIIWHAEYYGYDPILEDIGIIVKDNDKNLKVLSAVDTPEFARASRLMRRWNVLGIFNREDDPDEAANFKAGKFGGKIDVINIDSGYETKNKYSFDFIIKPFAPPVLMTNGVIATMNGICRNSSNPEAALRLLEQINTEPDVYNTLAKGIEGTHWVWADKAKKLIKLPPGVTPSTSAYNPNTDWMFGNSFQAYPAEPDLVGVSEEMNAVNKQARASVALGFVFDTAPVKSQVAQVQAVYKEFAAPINYGRVDTAKALPTLRTALKNAGMDAIVAEAQRQIRAWAKTK